MSASNAVEVLDDRPSFRETTVALITQRARDRRGNLALFLLVVLVALGVVGVGGRIADGFDDRSKWGYYAATVAFLLSTASAAPMAAIAPAIAKADWVRPVTRAAQLFTVVGVFTALFMLPLVFALPPLVENEVRRRSIWFGSWRYAPQLWDTVAVFGLAFTGLALLWASSLPDLAAIRDHASGARQRWARRLAPGFVGTDMQWKALRMRIGMLSAAYFMVLVFTHFLFAADFAMALVGGWKDAIFPAYHGLTSLQSGLAATIVAAFFIRKLGRLERYLTISQFWPMSKLLLALSLLWFYFFFSSFIVLWYGRTNVDGNVLQLLTNGPYWWAFVGAFVLSFLTPMWTLIWNPLRTSVKGGAIIAGIVLVGCFLDRVRLYAAAWSATDSINERFITQIPATVWPDIFDVFVMLGALSCAALLYVLASRFLPALSLWEVQQSRLITRPARFLRTGATIVGKPD